MNIANNLLKNGRDDDIAFVTQDSQFSYREFREICTRFSSVLISQKILPGDSVGILGVNSVFWAAAYLASMKIGAVAVPFSTVFLPEELYRNIQFSACKILFTDRLLLKKYPFISSEFPHILLDESSLGSASVEVSEFDPDFDPSQDAALMFTSGTTSRPRAVRITHRNIQANTDSIIQYLTLNSQERIFVILPFFYCYGASLLHTHLCVGATLVLSNSFAFPERTLDLMETTSCTGLAGVPSTFQILLRNTRFSHQKFPALHKIQQAGGKLHNAFLEELIRSQPGAQVYVMYGQTEATARLSYLPPEFLATKLGSIGKGIPGVSLQVLNEHGHQVQPGEVGEIVATGDNISPGYLQEPEANAEKFIDGKLFTGDLATIDEDRFLYIVDRKSDFIKSYGYRISSYDIETCVVNLSDVVNVAAIGIPDDMAGELIVVFVTLRKDSSITAKDIIKYCHSYLAKNMQPHDILILDSLPMNAQGKIIKSELRMNYQKYKSNKLI